VTANVQLGYAGTVHAAQGRTVTTARGLVTEATSAEALYVMMSRGQRSNDAYVVTDDPDREAHQRRPARHHLSVLAAIVDRDDAPGRVGRRRRTRPLRADQQPGPVAGHLR
jgi:hypothetical protein